MTTLAIRLSSLDLMNGTPAVEYSFGIFPEYYEAQGEDGPYTATRYSVECRDSQGHRWIHFKTFTDPVECDILLHRIVAGRPEGWIPEPNDCWHRGPLVYGSLAFQLEGGAHEQQKIDVEAEFGPGSYNPGHPGWLA